MHDRPHILAFIAAQVHPPLLRRLADADDGAIEPKLHHIAFVHHAEAASGRRNKNPVAGADTDIAARPPHQVLLVDTMAEIEKCLDVACIAHDLFHVRRAGGCDVDSVWDGRHFMTAGSHSVIAGT